MLTYVKKKRSKVDRCNICGIETDLTWDHVPPKCCFNNGPVKYKPWIEGVPKENDYRGLHQNGLRFRSLCPSCNNSLLGIEYDPEFESFVYFVKDIVTTKLVLPEKIQVSCKLNRVARAIVGHLLSAKNFYDDISIPE